MTRPVHVSKSIRLSAMFCLWFVTTVACVQSGVAGTRSVHRHVVQQFDSRNIRETSRRVMEHRDFRSLQDDRTSDESDESPGFLQKIFDSLERLIDYLFGGTDESTRAQQSSSSFGLSQIILLLAIVAITVAVILIVVAVIRSIESRKSLSRVAGPDEDGKPSIKLNAPPGELPANLYAERAQALADSGQYDLAIRQLLLGSMSWIERNGYIRFRRGLTNRDYVRAVWRERPRRKAILKIAVEFEKIFFGRREANAQVFQNCLDQFQREFRETATKTVAV